MFHADLPYRAGAWSTNYQTNMGVVKLVVLVLSLFLAAVTAGDVTCESEYGGTCNLTSKTCYQDHQYDPCTSFVRSLNRPISSPPRCGECPGQQNTSGIGLQAQWVNVTASTYDSTFFNVHVSWGIYGVDTNLVQGFKVWLKQQSGDSDDPDLFNLGCVCLNASQRNYTFTYNSYLQYKQSGSHFLLAKVMMLPAHNQDANTKVKKIHFPRSCRDLPYDPIHCKPPEYGPPRNVQAYRSTCGLRENNSEEMSIRVSWDPPQVTSPYPDPLVYYVVVQDISHELSTFNFKTTNVHSASINHLNASLTYQANVITYVPCSIHSTGCSFPSNWVRVVPEPSSSSMAMPSSTTTVSDIIISTVPASTETSLSRAPPSGNNITEPASLSATPPSENNVAEPIAIASIAGVLLVALIIVIGIVIAVECLTYTKRHHGSVTRSGGHEKLIQFQI